MNNKVIEDAVRQILAVVGEDPSRNGLAETPERVSAMCGQLLGGYTADPDLHLKLFDSEGSGDMVVVKDLPLFSLCEHHLLPFYGKCHIAYIPQKKILGLSKFPRILECFASRLQVQERLTHQVADYLMEKLEAKGLICYMEAVHMCVVMRGIKAYGSGTVTVAKKGCFSEDSNYMKEFLTYIKG